MSVVWTPLQETSIAWGGAFYPRWGIMESDVWARGVFRDRYSGPA